MLQRIYSTLALLALISAVAACSTLNVGTALRLQKVDFINDDIASMVIAVDVPVVLVPLPEQSHFALKAQINGGDSTEVEAVLARAVSADLFQTLPPPAQDRGYFIFEIAEASKAELRALQDKIRPLSSANGGPGGSISSEVEMRFCKTAEIDPARTEFSVLIALPGSTTLDPIVSNMSLKDLMDTTNQSAIPSCAEAMQ